MSLRGLHFLLIHFDLIKFSENAAHVLEADTFGLWPEQHNHGQADDIDSHQNIVGIVANSHEHHRPGLINPESRSLLSDLGDIDALVAQVRWKDLAGINPCDGPETAGIGLFVFVVRYGVTSTINGVRITI